MHLGRLGGLTASLVLVSLSAGAQDTTPPVGDWVFDGIVSDRDTQDFDTILEAKWKPFEDPESPIMDYAVAVGTAPNCPDVTSFRSVELLTEAYWHYDRGTLPRRLSPGKRYFITVRATNQEGLSATASSDGVLVTLPDGGLPPGTDAGGTPECPLPPDAGVDGGIGDGGPPDGGSAGPDETPRERVTPLGWGCGTAGGFSSLALLVLGALGRRRGRSGP